MAEIAQNEVKAITHSDKAANVLRWVAFGAVGLYLWRVNRVEGKAMGSNHPNNFKISIDTERAVDAAFEVVPHLQRLNPILKTGIKEFVKGFNRGRKDE